MINKVVLVGRCVKKPDLRATSNDIAVATFTLAVQRPFKNQDGEYEADFIACVAWRKSAEYISRYADKGDILGVDGKLQVRSYEANDGSKRYVTEVICDSLKIISSKYQGESQEKHQPQDVKLKSPIKDTTDPFFTSSNVKIDDDDLPF